MILLKNPIGRYGNVRVSERKSKRPKWLNQEMRHAKLVRFSEGGKPAGMTRSRIPICGCEERAVKNYQASL